MRMHGLGVMLATGLDVTMIHRLGDGSPLTGVTDRPYTATDASLGAPRKQLSGQQQLTQQHASMPLAATYASEVPNDLRRQGALADARGASQVTSTGARVESVNIVGGTRDRSLSANNKVGAA